MVFIPDLIHYDPFPRLEIDGARVVIFDYDFGEPNVLDDFLERKRLSASARWLLDAYPLYRPCQKHGATAHGTSFDQPAPLQLSSGLRLERPDAELRLSSRRRLERLGVGLERPVALDRPVIFIAHGLGGLIFEEAGSLPRVRMAMPGC